jgi:hypothetical protein
VPAVVVYCITTAGRYVGEVSVKRGTCRFLELDAGIWEAVHLKYMSSPISVAVFGVAFDVLARNQIFNSTFDDLQKWSGATIDNKIWKEDRTRKSGLNSLIS